MCGRAAALLIIALSGAAPCAMAANDPAIENLERGITTLFGLAGGAAEDLVAKFQTGQVFYSAHNYIEALKNFRFAADRGLPEAQAALSQMHLDGLGVDRSYLEAARWSRLAASRGNVRSLRILSALYARGLGVPRSMVMSYALQHLIESFDPAAAREAKGYMDEMAKLMSKTEISQAGELAAQMGMPGNFLPVFDGFVAGLR